jgi:PAS domain S-box-containing protein
MRAVVDSSPSGLLMTDAAGTIVLVNREIERLFGYAREELLGRTVEVLVPERFRGPHPAFRAGFIHDPKVRAMGAGRELFGLRKDGTEVPIEIGLTPVATEEGLFVISSIVDITERKRGEARFHAALESSPNGIVMVDRIGRIVLVNREVERLFGYSREELLGQSIEILVPEQSRLLHPEFRTEYFDEPMTRAMGAGRELYGLRKDGTQVPVEIGLNPIDTNEGLFVLGSIVDITARKAAEAERQRLEEQLRQSQKLEAIGTLAGGIAHDFNNILGMIAGYAELAREAAGSQPAAADIDEVLKAAERGKELTQRILRFSRHQETVRQPVDLTALLGDIAGLLRAMLPTSIDIQVRVDSGVPRVLANATSVQQVVMNLATNARDAMPEGGALELDLRPLYVRDSMARAHPELHEGPYVSVTVADTGPGMEAGLRARVFEPFFTTKEPGKGSGLGLAIVHGIMREHHGAVILESEPGSGTRVKCLFPALETEEVPATVAFEPEVHGHGEHILFIDDEPSLAALGGRRLEALGYLATALSNPREALDVFRADPAKYAAVVTDYTMPGLTGVALARAIVSIRPDIPIVLLTGFIEDLPPEQLTGAGVRKLIRKPATIRELSLAVAEVLRPRA